MNWTQLKPYPTSNLELYMNAILDIEDTLLMMQSLQLDRYMINIYEEIIHTISFNHFIFVVNSSFINFSEGNIELSSINWRAFFV